MRQQLLPICLFFLRALSLALPETRAVVTDLESRSANPSPLNNVFYETLYPISDPAKLGKRAETLDLQNSMKLLWGSENGSAVLDADYPGEDEFVLNMEDFLSTILTVNCSTGQVLIDFATQAAFDAAKSKWIWVNQMAARHFFIIVKNAGCGTPIARIPYNITNVGFDTSKKRAMLNGKEVTYETCVHDGHLVIDTAPAPSLNAVNRRASVGKDVSITKDFSGNLLKVGTAPNIASLDCTDCGTTGILKVKLDVSIGFFKVKRAFVEFRAENVAARANIALSGQVAATLAANKELARIDVLGISIPGIARLSFGPAFGFGTTFNVRGSGKVTFGAKATLTPLSIGTICLQGSCSTGSTGFDVTIVKVNPTAQGNFNATGTLFTYVTLSAGASVFGSGFDAGIAVEAPQLTGTINAVAKSTGGVCNNPATKIGVEANIAAGISSFAYFGKDFLHPTKQVTLFSRFVTIYNQCFPL